MIKLFSTGTSAAIKKNRITSALDFIKHDRISTIPSMLDKIREVAHNPNASTADFATLCEMDQTSCIKVLTLANSAAYGAYTGDVIRDVKQAVTRIGVRKTREVITSTAVSRFFKSGHSVSDYSPNALWLNSVAVATSNRLLYQITNRNEPEDADPYLAGLLHNFAIPLEHLCFFEDGFKAAVEARALNNSVLADEETQHLGISHNELGHALAKHWHFSDRITNIIRYHHDPQPAYSCIDDELLHITRASQWICQERKFGYAEFSELCSDLYLASFNALGFKADMYDEVCQKLTVEMERLNQLGWFSKLSMKSSKSIQTDSRHIRR